VNASRVSDRDYFVFDFDSTFTRVEALDELAMIALRDDPHAAEKRAEIESLTARAMAGELAFDEALDRRLALLGGTRDHLDELVRRLRDSVSRSIIRNRLFFKRYAGAVYVISGGFREFVEPVVADYGIDGLHVFANDLRFDQRGHIRGFDRSNLLARPGGKTAQLRALRLPGMIHVIGDGYTDLEMRAAGIAHRFYAFIENVQRERVVRDADHVVFSFDEFLQVTERPMIQKPAGARVLLLESIHTAAAEIFRREGFQVEAVPGTLDATTLATRLEDVNILGIRSRTRVTAEALQHAAALEAIGVFCIGTNQLDLSACSLRGIGVFNAPYSNTRSVAEMVLGEIIMLERRVFERSTELHAGRWIKTAAGSREIRGKRIGIIGYGNIGSQVSVLAESLGMDVYYYDVVDKLAHGNATRCLTMPELLRQVDVVTVHVDDNPGNAGLIGERELALMRDGAVLLNLSRGYVVDVPALAGALRDGKLQGAALDVFPGEPTERQAAFESELRGIPNVILTPHIGGSTMEAQADIGHYVPSKVLEYLATGSSYGSANLPLVRLDRLRDAHRCIHIHRNVPGVLAAIDRVFADHQINIAGQYLSTNRDIGYVVTDVSSEITPGLTAQMRGVPNTIRFRRIAGA
jgi:D-3-phosphoglycerate dehydrogenase